MHYAPACAGMLDNGVLQGADMLSFLPLHLGALDWKSQLKPWILSWCGNISPTYLTHFDWFNAGHHPGCRVWQPPPVAADAALEQIAVSFHKRPLIQHIILIPCLFTATWRKLLGNICDLFFSVPLEASIWPNLHFEPLVVGLYFPLIRHKPWHLHGAPMLDNMACQLSGVPGDDLNWGGYILQKLFLDARSLDSLSLSFA